MGNEIFIQNKKVCVQALKEWGWRQYKNYNPQPW